jgi:Iap family predicted aminopeptidase
VLSGFEHELRAGISGRRAVSYVEELVAVGDRFVGADGDARAAELVRKRFRDWALEVDDRAFTTLGYRQGRVELGLDDGRTFEAVPPYFSPPTPVEGLRGELVYVGGGEEVDYEGVAVNGKIVVLLEAGLGYTRFWLGTFAALAARHGAIAMIVVHPLPWPYRMSMEAGNSRLENRFLPEQLPIVCVSAIDGGQLLQAIGRGDACARLVVESELPEVTSWNVSGVLRGTDLAEETVLVHAHRDHGLPPGANDNGSGFGTMMEVAAALAGTSPRRSIEFLCPTAEEGVTHGIASYIAVRQQEGTLGQIRAAIDLDMFGVGGRLKLVEVGLWPDTAPIPHTEWLMRWVEDLADELGYDVGRMTASWGVAESGRFIEAGVPAIWLWKPDDFYYHSVHDTVDKLDGNSLKAVGDLTAITLWRLANADELPAEV